MTSNLYSSSKPVEKNQINPAAILTIGKINSYDYAKGTYEIIGDSGTTNVQAIPATSIISSLLGIKSNYILEVGTPVLILRNPTKSGEAFIIGTIPSSGVDSQTINNSYLNTDPASNVLSELLDKKSATNTGAASYISDSMPNNIAPGESVIQNGTGAALTLLQTFASLKASDLAKIECFIQDDMVRILNKTFQHISSFGDYNIYNENGQLNVVWKGTNEEFESFGNDAKGDLGLGSVSADVISGLENPEKDFNADGKWRFVNYIGKLGNFIHMFVTDPHAVLMKKADGADVASGRFGLHVNEDGSFLCQSLSDIVLEKVVRIPVATEKYRWEETEAGVGFDPKYMKNWTPQGDEDLWQMAYKLRDYSKWFSEGYCNSGFLGNDRFYKPDVNAMDEPDTWAKNDERKQVDGNFKDTFDKTQEAYATIRIFKDGSIVLMDAYGSAISLAGGNVQISASKNLSLSATGNLNLTAKNVNITSIDSTTMASTRGSVDIVGDTLARLSSTNGYTIVESEMKDEDAINEAIKKDQRFKDLKDKMTCCESKKPINVLISAKGPDGNVVINATKSFFAKAKSALFTFDNFIINPLKAFVINKFVKVLNSAAYFMGSASFKDYVNSLKGFATKEQLPIETMLGQDANKLKSAVLFDDGMLDMYLKDDEVELEFLGFDIDAKDLSNFSVTSPGFKFKEFKPEENNKLMQSLTDQFLAQDEGESLDIGVELADKSKLQMGQAGMPWPGDAQMKKYTPRVAWGSQEEAYKSTPGYDLQQKAMNDASYSIYIQKDQ